MIIYIDLKGIGKRKDEATSDLDSCSSLAGVL